MSHTSGHRINTVTLAHLDLSIRKANAEGHVEAYRYLLVMLCRAELSRQGREFVEKRIKEKQDDVKRIEAQIRSLEDGEQY